LESSLGEPILTVLNAAIDGLVAIDWRFFDLLTIKLWCDFHAFGANGVLVEIAFEKSSKELGVEEAVVQIRSSLSFGNLMVEEGEILSLQIIMIILDLRLM